MTNSNIGYQDPVEQSDEYVESLLEECPVCGAVGLPERIVDHDCRAFKQRIQ